MEVNILEPSFWRPLYDFLQATYRKGVWNVKAPIKEGMIWQVGNDMDINIWKDLRVKDLRVKMAILS